MRRSFFAVAALLLMQPSLAIEVQSATNNYICAINEVEECRLNEACKRAMPGDVNLAPIVTLDIANKELVSASMTDKGRKEKIEGVKTTDKHVFLHGRQDEETWSAVISTESGVMTGSISAVGAAYVLFGNCAPQ